MPFRPRRIGNPSYQEAIGPTRSTAVKGPYERLKYDLRRVWECPVCHHRERAGGEVTSMICRCQASEDPAKQVCMKLIENGTQRTTAAVTGNNSTPNNTAS